MQTPKQANKFMFFLMIYTTFFPVAFVLLWQLLTQAGIISVSDAVLEKYVVIFQSPMLFLLPIIVLMLATSTPLGELIPHKRLSVGNTIMVIVLTFLFMPTIMFVSSIAYFFMENQVNEEITRMVSNMSAFSAILSFAVMPAVFEEAVFRGVIMTGYKRNGMLTAACIAGLFFGMMHMDLFQLIYTVIMGVVFGIFVYCTNSIYSSMIGHFCLNGIQIAYAVLFFKFADSAVVKEAMEYTQTFQDKIDSLIFSAWLTVFTLPFFIILLKRFIRKNKLNAFEYKYGISGSSLNINILDLAHNQKEKIVEKYFVLVVIFYVLAMIIQKILLKQSL